MKNHIIIDIDGTIANLEHRLHHIRPEGSIHGHKEKRNWDAFFASVKDDAPHTDIRALLMLLEVSLGDIVKFIYVSGRPMSTRNATAEWIAEHEFPDGPIYMRKDGDYRDDSIVKRELFALTGLKPEDVWFVLEDRDRVVKMWREMGLRCLQVAPGDF